MMEYGIRYHRTSALLSAAWCLTSLSCTTNNNIFASVHALATIPSTPTIAPEVSPAHLDRVSNLVSSALGDTPSSTNNENNDTKSENDDNDKSIADRYASARSAVSQYQSTSRESHSQLVYGELSVPVLATILDAVGVQDDEIFLDIGSGDGALVLGASLLYASTSDTAEDTETTTTEATTAATTAGTNINKMQKRRNSIRKAWGVDIVPGLVDRSIVHAANLQQSLSLSSRNNNNDRHDEEANEIRSCLQRNQSEVQFLLGDIHQPSGELRRVLKETTLAVCFATTWSAGNARNDDDDAATTTASNSLQGRKLPKLSAALSSTLSPNCRVVVVDGKLLTNDDGFVWKGDLKVHCPDTAPYSIASLYVKQ